MRTITVIQNGTIKILRSDGDRISELGYLTIDPTMDEVEAIHLSFQLAELTDVDVDEAAPIINKRSAAAKARKKTKQSYLNQAVQVPGLPLDPKAHGRHPLVPRLLMLQTLFSTNAQYPVVSDVLLAQLQERLEDATPKVELNAAKMIRGIRSFETRGEITKIENGTNKPPSYYITDIGRKWYIETMADAGLSVNEQTGRVTRTVAPEVSSIVEELAD